MLDYCLSICSKCQVILYGRYLISSRDLLIFYAYYWGDPIACCIACVSDVGYRQGNDGVNTVITLDECTPINKINLLKVLPQTFGLDRQLRVIPLGAYRDQVVNNLSKLGIPISNLQCAKTSAVRTAPASRSLPELTPSDCEIQVEKHLISEGLQVVRIPQGYQSGFDLIAWRPGHNKDEVYLIEVKSRTSDLSPKQADLMRKIRSDPCSMYEYLCGRYGVIKGSCQQYNLLTRCPYKVHFRVYRCFGDQVILDDKYKVDNSCRC